MLGTFVFDMVFELYLRWYLGVFFGGVLYMVPGNQHMTDSAGFCAGYFCSPKFSVNHIES